MPQQARYDGFRAIQMIQYKAQSAGNDGSFSRAVTPYWIIWVAPFGRVENPSSVLSPKSAYFWCVSWKGLAIAGETRLTANGFSTR